MTSTDSYPQLLLLHGWTEDPQTDQKWQPLMSELRRAGLESQFLAIPGLTSPMDQVWYLTDFVKWLKEIAAERSVILVGHSFGGQLAVRFASQYPEQVQMLILIDPAGIRPKSLKARSKRFVLGVLAKVGKPFFKHPFFRRVLYILARERDYYRASPVLRQTMANVLNEEITTDLAKIICPTLIIWGQQDQATPLTHAQVFQTGISGSRLVIIPEARHSPHYTHLQVVAQEMIAFVQSSNKEGQSV